MAELMQFNQNTTDPPKCSRPFINQRNNPDVANLKKRKLLVGVAEDLGLPAPKHKCCETIVGSEGDFLLVKGLVEEDAYTWIKDESEVVNPLYAQVNSDQGSNSFSGDTQSASTEVKLDSSFGIANSLDDASTSWATSGSGRSRSSSFHAESSVRHGKDVVEEEQSLLQDTRWHDIDCLEERISARYSKDSSEDTAEGLEEFLSSSGMDPDLFPLSAERWGIEQGAETQTGRQKPTIDQEFEQYFSMLML